ncbi:MAG TPA: YihY/virulence factor BrkB family protein [Bacillaceae bacterium]
MKMLFQMIKRFFKDRFHDQSALMAYFFMLSIFPFLIFVMSLLGYLPIYSSDVLSAIQPFVPARSYRLIENNLVSILDERRTRLTFFSFLAAFWLASMAVQALVRAMNDAYHITRKEGFLKALLKDLFLTAILVVTLTLSLLIPILEEVAHIFLSAQTDVPFSFQTWAALKWAIGSLYLFVLFTFVYKLVPSAGIPFSSVLPGSLFATVSWQAMSVGYSYYVSYASYSQLYGQLGSIIVLMIWFYFSAAVLLFGGLINAARIEKERVRT